MRSWVYIYTYIQESAACWKYAWLLNGYIACKHAVIKVPQGCVYTHLAGQDTFGWETYLNYDCNFTHNGISGAGWDEQ